jgi:hypothetical protein
MLDIEECAVDIAQNKQNPEKGWEKWKDREARNR